MKSARKADFGGCYFQIVFPVPGLYPLETGLRKRGLLPQAIGLGDPDMDVVRTAWPPSPPQQYGYRHVVGRVGDKELHCDVILPRAS